MSIFGDVESHCAAVERSADGGEEQLLIQLAIAAVDREEPSAPLSSSQLSQQNIALLLTIQASHLIFVGKGGSKLLRQAKDSLRGLPSRLSDALRIFIHHLERTATVWKKMFHLATGDTSAESLDSSPWRAVSLSKRARFSEFHGTGRALLALIGEEKLPAAWYALSVLCTYLSAICYWIEVSADLWQWSTHFMDMKYCICRIAHGQRTTRQFRGILDLWTNAGFSVSLADSSSDELADVNLQSWCLNRAPSIISRGMFSLTWPQLALRLFDSLVCRCFLLFHCSSRLSSATLGELRKQWETRIMSSDSLWRMADGDGAEQAQSLSGTSTNYCFPVRLASAQADDCFARVASSVYSFSGRPGAEGSPTEGSVQLGQTDDGYNELLAAPPASSIENRLLRDPLLRSIVDELRSSPQCLTLMVISDNSSRPGDVQWKDGSYCLSPSLADQPKRQVTGMAPWLLHCILPLSRLSPDRETKDRQMKVLYCTAVFEIASRPLVPSFSFQHDSGAFFVKRSSKDTDHGRLFFVLFTPMERVDGDLESTAEHTLNAVSEAWAMRSLRHASHVMGAKWTSSEVDGVSMNAS